MNEPLQEPSPQQPQQITLTEEQQKAIDLIKAWFIQPEPKEFKLGGYAGTGKTTIIKFLLENLETSRIEVSAFTGKACNVLQRKGIRIARTLHSLMYDTQVINGAYIFHLKSRLDMNPALIIVDEASMVSTELYNHLKSFNKKLLFIGDPGQLEPVGENPRLMNQPDFVLSKIHRQAEKSPIITLANDIREGVIMPKTRSLEGLLIRDKQITTQDLMSHDQVICARNKTRIILNSKVRAAKSLTPLSITLGEKIIVLRNNMSFGVFNGMLLFIEKIHNEGDMYWVIDAKDELGNILPHLLIWKNPYTTPQTDSKKQELIIPKLNKKTLILSDYGYCITCHKSQGSEWKSVLCVDEWMPPQVWDMKRWRYTAITRAAERLTYCV